MTNENEPTDETNDAVAVIGAGTMGSAMARRLLSRGRPVRVWNRSPEPLAELRRAGAEVFDDPKEAVAGASVVLTLLPIADVVRDVMVAGGVLEATEPGAVWAQMSTIGTAGTEELGAAVRSHRPDVFFVDAPVSGSRGPAESGELLILASGPDGARPSVDPVFATLGRRTLWLGPAGTGSRLKLVLNTWLAFEVEAAAEVESLATHFGIDDAVLSDAISGSPLVSAFAAIKLAKMQSGDDRADFALGMALKDLDLVGRSAGPRAAPVALAIAERWRPLVAAGAADLDVSAARHGLETDDEAGNGENDAQKKDALKEEESE